MTDPALSVIIPACNEAANIRRCLTSLLAQEVAVPIEAIVVANGCRDDTAEIARSFAPQFAAKGWRFEVLDLPPGGKIGALNQGDAAAHAAARLYLDADISCGAGLLAGLLTALDRAAPVYAGARLKVSPAHSLVSRRYARFWQTLPFITRGVSGAGLFAVNAAGRARWSEFPDLIADDAFVRALFSPAERVLVEADYLWPISEGFGALVKVRGRQDAGVRELLSVRPDLAPNLTDRPDPTELRRLARADPLGFGLYAAVALCTRLRRKNVGWARNR